MRLIRFELRSKQSATLLYEYHRKDFMHNIDTIQQELLLLRLQRANTDKRIQSLRHAIKALVEVFGPQILEGSGVELHSSPRNVARNCGSTIDICCNVLKESRNWLTFKEVMRVVHTRAPWISSRYLNPGVSVSNALRVLRHRGEAEAVNSSTGVVWRWAAGAESFVTTVSKHHELPIDEQLSLNNLTSCELKPS